LLPAFPRARVQLDRHVTVIHLNAEHPVNLNDTGTDHPTTVDRLSANGIRIVLCHLATPTRHGQRSTDRSRLPSPHVPASPGRNARQTWPVLPEPTPGAES